MTGRMLVLALAAVVVLGLGCAQKPPSRGDTREALHETTQGVTDDMLEVYDSQGIQGLIAGSQGIGELPIFEYMTDFGQLRWGGDRAVFFKTLVRTFNSGGPWDTLVGHWRWEPDSFGYGYWNRYGAAGLDSIVFEWAWEDSALASHNADLSIFDWSWTVVETSDVLTRVHADLRSDGTSYARLEVDEVQYGTELEDVRKIDASLTAMNVHVAFLYDYVPPTATVSLRLEIVGTDRWFEASGTVSDATAPFDNPVVRTGSYEDHNQWAVDIELTEPDADYIQLVDGELRYKGALAAYIKSEKRYEGTWPYLYVWLEYADGTTEPIEDLFAYLEPDGLPDN